MNGRGPYCYSDDDFWSGEFDSSRDSTPTDEDDECPICKGTGICEGTASRLCPRFRCHLKK